MSERVEQWRKTSANDSRGLLWMPGIRLRESEVNRPEVCGWLKVMGEPVGG